MLCPARLCKVRSFMVWPGLVQWCIAGCCHLRWGSISVLRGLALYGTVQSCPVRLCTARLLAVWNGCVRSCPVLYSRVRSCAAWFSELDLLFGMAGRGSVLLAQVLFGSLGQGMAFLRHGMEWCRGVRSCWVKWCLAVFGTLRLDDSWLCEVL